MLVSLARRRVRHFSAPRLMTVLASSALFSAILLVAMGSIVRVTGNGLGCPDWPLCYGRVIPPALTGAWVEFTHRLLGGLVSVQILLLGGLAWHFYRLRPAIFRPAMLTLVLLLIQVGLGGLHVLIEIPPTTGLIHTAVAMLIVGVLSVLFTEVVPAFQRLRDGGAIPLRNRPFAIWVTITLLATYGLLLTGSYVTRSGASLVCPAFPWCGSSAPTLQSLITIQMWHRYAAFTVAFLTLITVGWLWRGATNARLKRMAWALVGLLVLQIGLGITNVLLGLPMWSRVLHLTVAATFWAGVVSLWTLSVAGQWEERELSWAMSRP